MFIKFPQSVYMKGCIQLGVIQSESTVTDIIGFTLKVHSQGRVYSQEGVTLNRNKLDRLRDVLQENA
jgi:hypothetical protein